LKNNNLIKMVEYLSRFLINVFIVGDF
jgi:hypothetical protein